MKPVLVAFSSHWKAQHSSFEVFDFFYHLCGRIMRVSLCFVKFYNFVDDLKLVDRAGKNIVAPSFIPRFLRGYSPLGNISSREYGFPRTGSRGHRVEPIFTVRSYCNRLAPRHTRQCIVQQSFRAIFDFLAYLLVVLLQGNGHQSRQILQAITMIISLSLLQEQVVTYITKRKHQNGSHSPRILGSFV